MKSSSGFHLLTLLSCPICCCEILRKAEFAIPGHTVADITVPQKPRRNADGSMSIKIEALTIAE